MADGDEGRGAKRARLSDSSSSSSIGPPPPLIRPAASSSSSSAPGAAPQLPLAELVLRRDQLARWCASPFLEKLVRHRFVRVGLSPTQSRLLAVVGLERAPDDYAVDFPADEASSSSSSASSSSSSLSSSKAPSASSFASGDVDGRAALLPSSVGAPRTTARTKTLLKLWDVVARKAQSVKITSISNSRCTPEEVAELERAARGASSSSSSSSSSALPTPADARRALQTWDRVTTEGAGGRCCAVIDVSGGAAQARMWGVASAGSSSSTSSSSSSSSAPHRAVLVFRSWLAQDALLEQPGAETRAPAASLAAAGVASAAAAVSSTMVEDDGPGAGAAASTIAPASAAAAAASSSSSASSIPSTLGDETWASTGPELLQPCIAPGRDVEESGHGHGPMGVRERTTGTFQYLAAHRAGGRAGAGAGSAPIAEEPSSLALLAMNATPYDEGQPDLTAWRAARQYVDADLPLELFRAAVVVEVDGAITVLGKDKGARGHQGHAAGGAAASTVPLSAPLTAPTGHRLRRLVSPTQVFVVDLDVIARAKAGTVPALQPAVASPDIPAVYQRAVEDARARAWLRRVVGVLPLAGGGGGGGGGGGSPHAAETADAGQAAAAAAAWPSSAAVTNPRVLEMARVTAQKEGAAASAARLVRDGASEGAGAPLPYLSCRRFPNGLAWLSERQLLALVLGAGAPAAPVPSPQPYGLRIPESDISGLGLDPSAAALLRPHVGKPPSAQGPAVAPAAAVTETSLLPDASDLSEGLSRAYSGSFPYPTALTAHEDAERAVGWSGALPPWALVASWAAPKWLPPKSGAQPRHFAAVAAASAAAAAAAAAAGAAASRSGRGAGGDEDEEGSAEDPDEDDDNYGPSGDAAAVDAAAFSASAASSAGSTLDPFESLGNGAEDGEGDDGEEKRKPVAWHPHGKRWVPHLFPHRVGAHLAIVYHGTSTVMAAAIARVGFRRAACRRREACARGRCDCNMLGFGCYFGGDRPKAEHFALRRAVHDRDRKAQVGAVVVVRADLGQVKVSRPNLCPCGCGHPYVDHWGLWYTNEGHDALYVRDNSAGAVRDREWALADPARAVVVAVDEVAREAV
jgi:hypothetical protein